MQSFEYISENEDQTSALAEKLAGVAELHDVFALYGTLGMGKSVFCRAFIKKLTGAAEVPSPTFTLLQVYEAKNFDIYHYDFYRIKSPEEIFELGVEDAFLYGVSLIEWPEKMGAYIPKNAIIIKFSSLSDGKRKITIICDSSKQTARVKKCMGKL